MTQITDDIIAISQVVYAERYARDAHNWEQMRNTYHPDATVEIAWFTGSGYDFVKASRTAFERGQSKHRLSPSIIRVHGNRALAETSILIETRTMIDNIEIDTEASIRMFSRVRKDAGIWRLASLTGIFEKDRMMPVNPSDELHLDRELLASFRPSYRFLSYVIHSYGHGINRNLPGDDRPETVIRLYDEASAWLEERNLA
jgi:SnoaL-like domain